MKIKGLNLSQIRHCASKTNIALDNVRSKGNFIHFKVNLIGEHYRKYKFDRKINAVCWHSFRDFIREIYKVNSQAIIVTGIARYDCRDNFERTYYRTGIINVGSQAKPLFFEDACRCNETNIERVEEEFLIHNKEFHNGEFDYFEMLDDDNNVVGLACDCGEWLDDF